MSCTVYSYLYCIVRLLESISCSLLTKRDLDCPSMFSTVYAQWVDNSRLLYFLWCRLVRCSLHLRELCLRLLGMGCRFYCITGWVVGLRKQTDLGLVTIP